VRLSTRLILLLLLSSLVLATAACNFTGGGYVVVVASFTPGSDPATATRPAASTPSPTITTTSTPTIEPMPTQEVVSAEPVQATPYPTVRPTCLLEMQVDNVRIRRAPVTGGVIGVVRIEDMVVVGEARAQGGYLWVYDSGLEGWVAVREGATYWWVVVNNAEDCRKALGVDGEMPAEWARAW
jgi:hypothetical protein